MADRAVHYDCTFDKCGKWNRGDPIVTGNRALVTCESCLARMAAAAQKPPRWLKIDSHSRLGMEVAPASKSGRRTGFDFDEIYLELRGKCFLHLEMMDDRHAFMSVGHLRLWLTFKGDEVTVRDARAPAPERGSAP